jgi:hypothetical protein
LLSHFITESFYISQQLFFSFFQMKINLNPGPISIFTIVINV